jgi:hypothetical protein
METRPEVNEIPLCVGATVIEAANELRIQEVFSLEHGGTSSEMQADFDGHLIF